MTTEAAAKKDTQKLQRAIIDGLEDVKAQDIQVFDTEHLSPLFERVIVASGTSNRQTKALAASVRDAVREAGFGKPRIEGEENGEWIIVDCGAAVAHIMQPAIRQYYHLEEIWGDKPVRAKLGGAKPAASTSSSVKDEPETKKKGTAKEPTLRRSSAAKTAIRAAEQEAKAAKAPAKRATAKTAAKKAPAKKTGTTTARVPVKVVGKPAAKKPAAKKTAAAKKAPARRA
ncbi:MULTISPECIES: ribosome silencing factor [Variovorax]|jgi:ribosome-associated protein|uniref:ribosome silencing factor n=1 Tax=Variovorax TaxID=34072 RepID=UPI00086F2A57|nr:MULTISPECIES: ribosome silencing factor [Variovorax]MBN8752104.1 ribosome silencing factor [Variovorax sp.]ODU15522.1 MAG: ribosome silencing factor [Variovorax sp. SCN 67-85]ODV17115.1 MAG: ribosome silencing factor [Variovorax sp. SCN 67-20]OJZ09086.1 MAG: ribosome silencing factor [Variovorax sp. 67-131]UKI11555.1 ribosome silencing factor [Variovorax paradoxus]